MLRAGVILLLLSGCFRSVIIDEQRQEDVVEQLEARRFKGNLQSLRKQVRSRLPLVESAASTPVDELLSVDELDEKKWKLCFSPGTDDCVEAQQVDSAHVKFAVACDRRDHCAERIWEALAPGEVRAADGVARARAEDRATIFEDQFVGHWTLAGSAWGGVRSYENATSLGLRVGARRWLDPYLLAGLLLEYERTFMTPARNNIALQIRVEMATYMRWSQQHWHLPEASAYLFIAPAVDLSNKTRYGLRAGIGAQVVRLTPVFMEMGLQTLWPDQEVRVIVRIGMGV
jgi:hypothetical protein